jgi:phosphoribosylaminoimidazole-succinocarboxamide synthase
VSVLLRSEVTDLALVHRGKVRDTYAIGDDRLLLLATDRISAFDVVFGEPVPRKGEILTRLSAFWFELLAGLGPSHYISIDASDLPEAARAPELVGRGMLVHRARRIDVECVVRGYLAGSGWAEYRESGVVGGHQLPDGLREADRLPAPIFTPATKAETGHDENITRARLADLVGSELAARLEDRSLALYAAGARHAADRGLILADTKFEFGFVGDRLTVIDELLTPDSSRFWDAAVYAPGTSPASFDKQYLRDFLAGSGWNREPPPPRLPDAVIAGTAERYAAAYERLTGEPLPERSGA